MISWEESESASFCFIIALAKVHPLFFSFRPCYALAYGVHLSFIFEGFSVLSEAFRSTCHATQ